MKYIYLILILLGCSSISEYRIRKNVQKGRTDKALQISYKLLNKHKEGDKYSKYFSEFVNIKDSIT